MVSPLNKGREFSPDQNYNVKWEWCAPTETSKLAENPINFYSLVA